MAYTAPSLTIWQGRVDSRTNYDAFRWHQWIKPLDLSAPTQIPRPSPEPSSSPGERDYEKKCPLKIGFIGFACDEGIRLNKGRQGAALGPQVIRKELSNLPCLFTQEVALLDCGDILVTGDPEAFSLTDLQIELSQRISQMLDLGIFPIVLGGGHELALGHYLGLKTHFPHIAIVNLDAHLDMRPYKASEDAPHITGPSSGTMFRQIADLCKDANQPFPYLCLGVQRRGNTVDLLKTALNYGAQYVYARDMIEGDALLAKHVLQNFMGQNPSIYLTLCTDVIASAYAPGVSAAQPLGLHPEAILTLIRQVVRSKQLVAFDVAEVSPRFDQDNTTANLACTYIFAVVNELAELAGCAVKI